jgi:uncharacterized RDD family membrane protein YckC
MTATAVLERDRHLTGCYANVASRAVAFLIDVVTIAVTFAIGSAVVERIIGVFTDRSIDLADARVPYVLSFVAWVLLYCAYPLAVAGRTFGMAVLGLRAVRADGSDLDAGRAVLRVVVFPLSFLLFGIGFLLIVLRRDHRALHDLICNSAVVYSWNARAAHMRFLTRPSA